MSKHLKNNRLIAEFMGLKPVYSAKKITGWANQKDEMKYLCNDIGYHKDWNALMPVITRIERMQYDVVYEINRVGNIGVRIERSFRFPHITIASTQGTLSEKISVYYEAVVRFVKWQKG